ncbi:hypothetical protein HZH66_000454 [Vespula vulgaris]|uniref:Cilia- and flagella-associated protein 299 n=1 Tax=Vespula vulgaris TaxID=7454 RepID=A0A834NL48_VESVU|nr:cilia- and flagella-associated protein 299-like [Vespula vulgaris]KAF7411558.1 hypothetical protein HZH66_000454 [Vespula vulgaris]
MTTPGTQLDSDRTLLQFKNYEEYLNSLVTPVDFCYLRNTKVASQLAELGYRCTGETLDKDAFYQRLQIVKDLLYPIPKAYHLTSEFLIPFDPLMQELAIRERSNRLHILSTVIFVRHNPRLQVEVSGYIDYNERLKTEDWQPYFEGKRKLWPKITDLTYYHWKVGKMQVNVSSNYEPVIDSKHGLLLKNVHDRKYINVDPKAITPGVDTTRIRIYSDAYKHVILYDHVIRRVVVE